jgi:non-catalytic primase subunit PriX-like protein
MNLETSYFLETPTASSIEERRVTKGLEFILSHLNKPTWPRTISTKLTEGRQFIVHSRLEALSYFKDSKFLDCRISAYSPDSRTLDFIMIDIDRSNFKSMQELNDAKTRTISKISSTFRPYIKSINLATVICSGRGYHLYIPADSKGKILEQIPKFKKFREPSKEFLRFAEWYLSSGKCDNEHNKTISFNNCMLRIPGSFNSKNNVQIRIVQKWKGPYKVPVHLLYDKFLNYLLRQSQKLTYSPQPHSTLSASDKFSKLSVLQRFYQRRSTTKNSIPWIEKLLITPLSDHRKYSIWRILAPYLINVKRLSFDEAFDTIDRWLKRCDKLNSLDFDSGLKINGCLTNAVDRGYLPISLDDLEKEPRTLRTENRELYDMLVTYD